MNELNMKNYKVELQKDNERNTKFLKEFEEWLNNKNMSQKTITKHLNNMSLYLSCYLNYYEETPMEQGIDMAYDFLSDWFIRKCIYASRTSIIEHASSIKKFYCCMKEKNYVSEKEYKELCAMIKSNTNKFLRNLRKIECSNDDYWGLWGKEKFAPWRRND